MCVYRVSFQQHMFASRIVPWKMLGKDNIIFFYKFKFAKCNKLLKA